MSANEERLERLGDLLRDDLEHELAPRPGDAASLAGLVAGTMRATVPGTAGAAVPQRVTSVASGSSKVSLAVAALLGGGLVLAGVLAASWLARPEPAPGATLAPAIAPDPERVEATAPAPAPETPPEEMVEHDPGLSSPEATDPTSVRNKPNKVEKPATTRPPSAAELFAQANRQRRDRDYSSAELNYERLADLHPGTREELMSRVTRGRILLDVRKRPALALVSFDAYLAAAPRGTMAEEAMVGRALSLEALGRADDARGAWRTLLERFPDSLQATRARAAIDGQ